MTSTEFPSATAIARFVHVSPSKARRVIDLVRGKSVSEALDILRWTPQAASAFRCTYWRCRAFRLLAKAVSLNCGLWRDRGIVRMSTSRSMP